MSFICRRGLSTLIPPKIASPSAIGATQDAVRMQRVVSFYAKLPRGPAPKFQPKGILQRYANRYFYGENASKAPIVHLIAIFTVFGYAQHYYFHIRHHKHNAH
ncbi:ATP synthase f chain, mitochondrial precursor [Peltigera leucophlebia]|nr:ATP synthase f chain, mitochondrial precursor [Peltigera leucophlebia]